jgi:hypothetical protein
MMSGRIRYWDDIHDFPPRSHVEAKEWLSCKGTMSIALRGYAEIGFRTLFNPGDGVTLHHDLPDCDIYAGQPSTSTEIPTQETQKLLHAEREH